jgi:flagellar hook protein FlgE
MSVTSTLAVGISGMNANANAMSGVADNIANINTVGYKRAETAFSSLVAGQTDDGGRTGGVTTVTRSLVSKQGLIQASSGQTDLAIDGNGFFVTRTGASASDPVAFTRAGSFTPDSAGFLRNSTGMYLQGWRLDSAGKMIGAATMANVTPIQINELSGTATPTSKISISANLDARAATGTTFTNSITYYDSLGGSRQVDLVFTKNAAANSWQCDLKDGATTLATGNVTFNTNGTLASVTGTINTGTTPISVTTTNAGTSPLTLDFGTVGQSDGMRQFADSTALLTSSADGGLLRTITSIDVTKSGQVNVMFDDGTSRPFFQLPLATFSNPDGLASISGNAYFASPDSGVASIGQPGTLGAGSIKASSLEASNVDLAEEFSNMIRFQRAYSASSRIITTADEMLQEANNLKR